MKFLALIFAALLMTGLAVWTAQSQGGEIIVHIADFTARLSLLVALLFGIGTLFGVVVLVWLLSQMLGAPERLRQRKRNRRRQRTDALLVQGLRNMLENRLEMAQRNFEQAIQQEPKRPLFHLLAALTGARSNDRSRWSSHLRAIDDPEYQMACTWIKAEGLIAAGEWEEALAALQVLASDSPDHPRILRHLAHCYQELQGWRHLFELARSQAKLSNLPQEEVRAWLHDAAHHLCEDTDGPDLQALWTRLGEARSDPHVLRSYIDRLRHCGETHPELEPRLRQVLDANLDDMAIELYGNLPGPVTPGMIKKAGKWLAKDPERVSLKRALARLHIRLGQHDLAREQLETIKNSGGDPRLYRELAEALEQAGQSEAAQAYYRKGLRSLGDAS